MTSFFGSKNTKVFQWIVKSKSFNYLLRKTKVHKRTETKSDIFLWDKWKSNINFLGQKILKYFNKFWNPNL